MKILASGSGAFLRRKTCVFVVFFPSMHVGGHLCLLKCVCLTAATGSSGGKGTLCQLSNYV